MIEAEGRRTVLTLCAGLLLVMVGFANYGAVLPGIIADLRLSEGQAGFAGGIFFLSYAVASPLCSALTDMLQPRRIYLAGCAMGVAGGLLFPLLSDSYPALLASRALSGLGMAGAYVPGMTLLAEALPPSRRARSASIYTSCLTLGTSLSFASAALLRMAGGWSFAFVGAAAASLLAAAAVWALVPPRPGKPAGARSLLANLGVVLRSRTAMAYALAGAGNAWEGMAFRVWWIALLAYCTTLPGNAWFDGVDLALLSSVSGPLAMPVAAWVAARAERGPRAPVIACAAFSSVLVGLLLMASLNQSILLIFLITLVYQCAIFSDAGSLPVAAMAQVPAEARGAVLAVQVFLTNTGSFLGASLCGVVLAAGGGVHTVSGWRWGLAAMLSGSLLTSLTLLWVHRRGAR